MNEGGQSSTGQVCCSQKLFSKELTPRQTIVHLRQLLDFVMQTHPAFDKVQDMAREQGSNVFDILETKLEELKKERGCTTSSKSLNTAEDSFTDSSLQPS